MSRWQPRKQRSAHSPLPVIAAFEIVAMTANASVILWGLFRPSAPRLWHKEVDTRAKPVPADFLGGVSCPAYDGEGPAYLDFWRASLRL